MTPDTFLSNIALKCISSIAEAVSTGAQWEIASHIFLSTQIKTTYNIIPLREMRYSAISPTIDGNEACDIVFPDPDNKANHIWLEIKVESATSVGKFAGASLASVTSLSEANADWVKLKSLPDSFTVTYGSENQFFSESITIKRWIMVVAYSPAAKKSLGSLVGNHLTHGAIAIWLRDIDT